jgi:hypothetical protein
LVVSSSCTHHDPAVKRPTPRPLPSAVAAGGLYWLLNSPALAMLTGNPAAARALNTPRTLAVVRKGLDAVPPGWPATRVSSFASYRKLHQALKHGTLPSGIGAVLYDPEHWAFTPADEQRDPGHFAALAAADAHAHGLRLVATPATNLVQARAPGTAHPYPAFLDMGILTAVAQHADVIDIQAQGSVSTTSKYADFVNRAAAQARAANPAVIVIAGISTNPAGAPVTLDELRAAVEATRATVDGYWLNIPMRGKYCPRCNPARPDLAIALLAELSAPRAG